MRNVTKTTAAAAVHAADDDPMHGTRAVRAKEVAAYLGLSYDQTVKLTQAGEIPGAKVGGVWLYSPKVIRRLLGDE